MTLLYGRSETMEKMKMDKMGPSLPIRLDKDFYTNNHQEAKRKIDETNKARKDHEGDSVGFKEKINRNPYAMGGAVKERRGFWDS